MRTERITGLVLLTHCNCITGTSAYAEFHVLADGLDVTIRTCAAIGSTLFYVLLTVHLGIILVSNQLYAQFFFMYVYFYSLHVLKGGTR